MTVLLVNPPWISPVGPSSGGVQPLIRIKKINPAIMGINVFIANGNWITQIYRISTKELVAAYLY